MYTHSLKIGLIACMALAAAAGARPRNGVPRQPGGPEVMVCLRDANAVTLSVLALARSTATNIFATIDVQLKWCEGSEPPGGTNAVATIGGQIDSHVPEEFHPGALAYASPYQPAGTRIHVFAERMPKFGLTRLNGLFLGHVMAHEIAHVLEGLSSHSASGVMKARWDNSDTQQMMIHPLSFSEEDVLLIHTGLAKNAALARR